MWENIATNSVASLIISVNNLQTKSNEFLISMIFSGPPPPQTHSFLPLIIFCLTETRSLTIFNQNQNESLYRPNNKISVNSCRASISVSRQTQTQTMIVCSAYSDCVPGCMSHTDRDRYRVCVCVGWQRLGVRVATKSKMKVRLWLYCCLWLCCSHGVYLLLWPIPSKESSLNVYLLIFSTFVVFCK